MWPSLFLGCLSRLLLAQRRLQAARLSGPCEGFQRHFGVLTLAFFSPTSRFNRRSTWAASGLLN